MQTLHKIKTEKSKGSPWQYLSGSTGNIYIEGQNILGTTSNAAWSFTDYTSFGNTARTYLIDSSIEVRNGDRIEFTFEYGEP